MSTGVNSAIADLVVWSATLLVVLALVFIAPWLLGRARLRRWDAAHKAGYHGLPPARPRPTPAIKEKK